MKMSEHLKLKQAFERTFKKDGKLTSDAKEILQFLKNQSHYRGDNEGIFINNDISGTRACYLLGQRHIVDAIIKYINIDEDILFNTASLNPSNEEVDVLTNLIINKDL